MLLTNGCPLLRRNSPAQSKLASLVVLSISLAAALHALLASADSSSGIADLPKPPGWKDTSTSIDTLAGRAVSCPMDGYLWYLQIGADFSVAHFHNYDDQSSSAGFYLGDHPHSLRECCPPEVEAVMGKLNGQTVKWIRSSLGDSFKLETVEEVLEPASHRMMKMHFWINLRSIDEQPTWLRWSACFHFESEANQRMKPTNLVFPRFRGRFGAWDLSSSRLKRFRPYSPRNCSRPKSIAVAVKAR